MPLDISSALIEEKNKQNSNDGWLLLLEISYLTEDIVRLCLDNQQVTWPSSGGEIFYPAVFKLSGMSETKSSTIPKITLNFYDLSRVFIPILREYGGCSGASVTIRIVNSAHLSDTVPALEEEMEIVSASISDSTLISLDLGSENLYNLRIPKQRYLKNNCRFRFKSQDFKFTSGGVLEPVVGNYIKGSSSGAIAKILSINMVSDTWVSGTAVGYMRVLTISGQLSGEVVGLYSDEACTTLLQSDIFYFLTIPTGRCNYIGTATECDKTFARCKVLENQERFGGFPGVGKVGINV